MNTSTTAQTITGPRTDDGATTPAPAVSVRDLRRSYGDFEAVRGVSFDVAPGELFALLGTNGAGKTTTIETLEGFSRPSGGTVRVFGQDPHGQPVELRTRMNAVLQHSGGFDELSVAETIDLARDLTGDPLSRDEALGLVNLHDKSRTFVRDLSGGEKRRLDLALALVTRPEVLFLDEPTTGMDPEARRATWTVIRDTVAAGTAVLLTTHYLEEAEQLADHLAIMHRGEIRVAGTVTEVLASWGDHVGFRAPEHIATADLPDLLGASPSVQVRDGHPWVGYTVHGTNAGGRAHRAVAELLAWAERHDVVLEHLEVRSASLEDVFLGVATDAE